MIHRLLAVVTLTGLAVAQVGVTQNAGGAERILKDLASRKYQVQRRAVLAARETKGPKLLERLLVLAQGDSRSHPNIRGYACETLGYYRDPRIFDVLAATATKGPLSARGGAKRGLGRLRDPRAYDLLIKALDDRHTWSATAEGLMLLADKRAAGPLSKLLRAHKQDHFVHGKVAEAIVVLDPELATKVFFELIHDPKTWQHHHLDRLLARVKTADVRARAGKLLESEEVKIRARGVRILGGAGDARSVAVLLDVMAKDKELRWEAMAALGELGNELAVPQIARYLQDSTPKVRAASAHSLGKIGHQTAVRYLVVALRKEEEILPKLRLVEALGRIGDKRAVKELGRHLGDKEMQPQAMRTSSVHAFPYNTPVSWAAWWALCRIRDGKEPRPLEKTFSFHGWGGEVTAAELAAVTKWWEEHRSASGFSITK